MADLLRSPVARWILRALITVEAIDGVVVVADQDWLAANPWLIALASMGLMAAVLAWLPQRGPGLGLLVLGLAALMAAVAPSTLYPLSALLLLAGIVWMAAGVAMGSRQRPAPRDCASQ